MANIKSAIKRIDVTKRNTLENKLYKSNVKTFTKKYLTSINEYKENPNPTNLAIVKQNLSMTFSKIDKATKKNILHSNTAARKKSALTKAFSFIKA
jgi:small subunit ribosomal protein S20